jgi:hypothetical protein
LIPSPATLLSEAHPDLWFEPLRAGDPERFGRGGRYGAVLALALWLLIAWGIVVLWRLAP